MSDLIDARLARLEERLAKIESHLNLVPPLSVVIPPITPVTPESLDEWADGITPDTPHHSASVPSDEKPMNWLGYAAIVCFVLAAGFIIKLSIESGWLTPARQVGIAALFGTGLIVGGLKLMKLDRAYASLLPSAGIIIFYLTGFGAHRLYNIISFETAIVVTTLVSALCLWLYHQIKHDAYAVTASIGAYLSPVILALNVSTEFSLYYFLVCSAAFALISIFLQSRILLLVSANLAILLTAVVGFDIENPKLIAIHLAVHFVIFTIATYFYSKRHRTALTEGEAWSFMPVLLLFYAAEYYNIYQISQTAAPWISLAFAGFLLGLYMSARRLFPDGLGSQSLILTFVTLVCIHSVYLELLPADFRPWLLVVFALGAAFLPVSKDNQNRYFIPLLAVGGIAIIEYADVAKHLWDTSERLWIIVSLATVASLWILIATKSSHLRARVTGYYALLGSAHFLAILGLYRLTNDIGSLAVSASWLFYAVAIMLFATPRKDDVMAKSALIVLALAAGKALLYDASSAPTLVRIFCLLLTGAVLYGCGFLMRRVATWNKTA